MPRKQVALRPEVYHALLAEARVRQQDPETVLEEMILSFTSPKSKELLEDLRRNMETKPPLEDNPEAIEAIKDMWVDYPRLSTAEMAEKIGYPYEEVSGTIRLLLRKGELEPRGHLPPKQKRER